MHQSSLGSMLLIAGTKLHELWHTPFLPLLFLINAMFMGYSIVILESILSSYAFHRPFEVRELGGLTKVIPWLTAVWLVVVFGDLVYRGQIEAAYALDKYSMMFLLEVGLLVAGAAILVNFRSCRSPRRLFASTVLIVLGGALYRFNVYLIGFNPGQGWMYFPSFSEIMISVGIVSIELLGYLVLVKMVPVLPKARITTPLQPQNA